MTERREHVLELWTGEMWLTVERYMDIDYGDGFRDYQFMRAEGKIVRYIEEINGKRPIVGGG